MKLDPYLVPYTKINSKWIKDLKVKLKTMKLLEENIRENLIDIGFGNNFFGYDNTKNTGNKSKNRQVRLDQTKSFCTAKETVNKV